MSIDDLIEAARFLESVDQANRPNAESNVGLCSSEPEMECKLQTSKRNKSQRMPILRNNRNLKDRRNKSEFRHLRMTHNELEKYRYDLIDLSQAATAFVGRKILYVDFSRAIMRSNFERLSELISTSSSLSSSSMNRDTTLSLLTKATLYIKSLQQEQRRALDEKNDLLAREQFLRNRLLGIADKLQLEAKNSLPSRIAFGGQGIGNDQLNKIAFLNQNPFVNVGSFVPHTHQQMLQYQLLPFGFDNCKAFAFGGFDTTPAVGDVRSGQAEKLSCQNETENSETIIKSLYNSWMLTQFANVR